MEPSKRVVFVSFRGTGDGKPRAAQTRARVRSRLSASPRSSASPPTPNGPPATCSSPVEYSRPLSDPSPRPSRRVPLPFQRLRDGHVERVLQPHQGAPAADGDCGAASVHDASDFHGANSRTSRIWSSEGDETPATSARTPVPEGAGAATSAARVWRPGVRGGGRLAVAAGANGEDGEVDKIQEAVVDADAGGAVVRAELDGSRAGVSRGGGEAGRRPGCDGGRRRRGKTSRRGGGTPAKAIGTKGIDAPIRGWSLSRSVCCRVWPPWCCCTRGSARSFPRRRRRYV